MHKIKIFYIFYVLCILLFFAGMIPVQSNLYKWLVDYEASQPAAKCEEIYNKMFVNPDWKALYDLSGEEDTLFEGGDAYSDYMTEKVGDDRLTYYETSAGLSGDKKYYLTHGEEKILSFTLVSRDKNERGIVYWKLGGISLFFPEKKKSVCLSMAEGHTACINGVALDDSYTIQKTHTIADNYLPEGIHGPHTVIQQLDGLLTEPEVTIRDENGILQKVIYDTQKCIYMEITEDDQQSMNAEDEAAVLTFAENYCKYMINAYNNLPALFEKDSEIYQVVKSSDRWAMQKYAGFSFSEKEVTDYIRYNDDIFYARVKTALNVNRPDGSVKKYFMDSAFFFRRQEDGSILAYETTNLDIRQVITEVLLIWKNDNGVIKTEFADSDCKCLKPPSVTAPEGYVFSGWMKETADEEGNTTRTLIFIPEADGVIILPENYSLEPMTLYPLFEKK